jgi:hypothetical protein
MSRIVVVPGIHTDRGPWFEFSKELRKQGHEVVFFEYAKRWAFHLFFPSVYRRDGRRLAHFMNPGDTIVAHSNGALVWQKSIEAGAKWGQCFIFGGAATSDKFEYPDDSLDNAYIVYNVRDLALKVGSMIPFHLFGRLGLRGFAGTPTKGIDRRFRNVSGYYSDGFLKHNHYATTQKYKWLKYINTTLRLRVAT